jgi:hypothetical protein
MHTVPAAQTLPHAPQLPGSVASVTQAPPHATVPGGQLDAHTPEVHTDPAAQVLPQAPQL